MMDPSYDNPPWCAGANPFSGHGYYNPFVGWFGWGGTGASPGKTPSLADVPPPFQGQSKSSGYDSNHESGPGKGSGWDNTVRRQRGQQTRRVAARLSVHRRQRHLPKPRDRRLIQGCRWQFARSAYSKPRDRPSQRSVSAAGLHNRQTTRHPTTTIGRTGSIHFPGLTGLEPGSQVTATNTASCSEVW